LRGIALVRAPAIVASLAEVRVEVAAVGDHAVIRELDRGRVARGRARGDLAAQRRGARERRDGARDPADHEGALPHERGLRRELLGGERHHRVLRVQSVVKECLAVGGGLQRLLADEVLLGVERLRVVLGGGLKHVVVDPHLGEERLELVHLGRVEVARLLRGPRALQRPGGARLRPVPDGGGLGAAVLGALRVARLAAHQLRVLVVAAGEALALLLLGGLLLLADLLLDLGRAVDLRRAVGEALRVRLAALLARRQPRAVLGRVPLLVAVATLVREEQGAAHRAVLLVLDPVVGELGLRALRVEAEGAELLVRLAADGCH